MSDLIKVECPSCGGFGDHGVEEDSGCLYACYACGMAGFLLVPPEVKYLMAWEAYKAAEALVLEGVAEAKRRAELGVPDGWFYGFDDYGDIYMVAPRGQRQPAPIDELEDIPF